ncbi:CHASE2 domain-containing protein [Oscillatoriales cyanobacterium USR001]|nr:CHASE2 domain-containing protein [Oscillatoriales cyanobacterium USR001]
MIGKFVEKISSALPKLSNVQKSALAFAKSAGLTSIAVTSLLIGARQIGMLEPLELGAFDQMVRSRPDEGSDSRLLVVGITEGDIQRLKEWPISDRKIAQVLQKLEQQQPIAIGLDVLRDVPLGEGRPELIQYLQNTSRLIGVCKASDPTGDNPGSPPPPGLATHQVGFADFGVDSGGVLRRALLFMTPPGVNNSYRSAELHLCNDSSNILFSFALQLSLRYLQTKQINPELTPDQSLKLGSTILRKLQKNDGGYKNIDDRGYQILINYRSARNVAKLVTLTDVIEDKIDPKFVKDKIVLIGYTSDTVKDYFYTPYSGSKQNDLAMPGVVAHAQVVSQILSAVLDKRPLFWFWSEWGEVLWLWGWSMVGGAIAWGIQQPLRFGLVGGGMLIVSLGLGFGIFMLGGWVPVAAPAIALIVSAGSVVLIDRFNKGGYGKVITDKVKQVFKLEIDQTKKEQEVAEITESDFFKELQQKKSEWKGRKRESTSNDVPQPQELETTESQSEEYFTQLQHKAKQQRVKITQVSEESTSEVAIAEPTRNNNSLTETPGDEGFIDLS